MKNLVYKIIQDKHLNEKIIIDDLYTDGLNCHVRYCFENYPDDSLKHTIDLWEALAFIDNKCPHCAEQEESCKCW
jgi:hypothetical protein